VTKHSFIHYFNNIIEMVDEFVLMEI